MRPSRATKEQLVAINERNDFIEMAPGQERSFDVNLQLDYWLRELEVGRKYCFRFLGKEVGIAYWRYGTIQVSLRVFLDENVC